MNNLRKKWADCCRCKIASQHKALYSGSESPLILFIVPSITHADSVTKKPLSGSAGKLLRKMAKDCSLSQRDYGVTALTACLTVKELHTSMDRNPNPEEIGNCKERLDETIETVLPKYYVSMGALVKKHPPTGIKFSLEMRSPIEWDFSGGEMSLHFKRDRHKLRKFLGEIGYGKKEK